MGPYLAMDILFSLSTEVVLVVKNLPANAGAAGNTGQSLGWEDTLELEMAIHSSILACKIPWTEGPGSLQSMGLQKSSTWLACAHKHSIH